MKKMILILFIILMIIALLPAAAFADTAKTAEEANSVPVGWTPFALPKDQTISAYAPSGAKLPIDAPSAPAVDPVADPNKTPGCEPAKTDKPADKTPEEIMEEIIAKSQETVPVKLISIALIPYISLPCT